eukprot:TRINITY_DN1027_c0_g1_i2.p2 TRINITY_DN1027_c0_g1~~TRINITY_DN1027_c0_g1_i2.p2  ORF type:complete len:227 (+),score=-15.03 TRINITY_DN1027_c0_g1_i2:558-1238(+)
MQIVLCCLWWWSFILCLLPLDIANLGKEIISAYFGYFRTILKYSFFIFYLNKYIFCKQDVQVQGKTLYQVRNDRQLPQAIQNYLLVEALKFQSLFFFLIVKYCRIQLCVMQLYYFCFLILSWEFKQYTGEIFWFFKMQVRIQVCIVCIQIKYVYLGSKSYEVLFAAAVLFHIPDMYHVLCCLTQKIVDCHLEIYYFKLEIVSLCKRKLQLQNSLMCETVVLHMQMK